MVHESDEETEAMLQQPDSGPIFSIKLTHSLSQNVSPVSQTETRNTFVLAFVKLSTF